VKDRIGVYICQCGSNISDYVDVEAVREAAEKEEGVALAKITMFACSDSAQNEIIDDIRNNDLDGLVVASCSPKLHLYTFRSVADRAGINPYNYVQANIREQGSWAHADRPKEATEKAVRIVRGAISRARLSEALTPSSIAAENVVLVVGAGIAGMKAAIELAAMGTYVYLIEKCCYVGGRVSQWGELFTTEERGGELVKRLYERIMEDERINLFTSTEIEAVSGSVGKFEVTIRVSPRLFERTAEMERSAEFKEKLDRAIRVCPEEIPDPFNFNLTTRKAIYPPHRGEYPKVPCIDPRSCSRCGKCAEILEGVDLQRSQQKITIEAGAVVLCTGFDPYQPQRGEFGYGEIENVMTLQEYRRLLELHDGDELTFKGRTIKNISYIYCVGSRQVEGENKYCSRYCCTGAIHAANLVRSRYRGIRNFHFHRGVRSYGKLEELYTASSTAGDIYFQCADEDLPRLERTGEKALVKIRDILTEGREMEVETDLVVLVTGMVPRENRALIDILKVPVGLDGFFNEVHPKLKPVEVVMEGIFIAGTCHFPKNVTETMNSALSASIKANALIGGEQIELEPTIAAIDRAICEWCAKCAETCPFDAIEKASFEGRDIAVVKEASCKGCGMCLPVCPVNAIQLMGYTDAQIESLIDAIAE
jgi:heterodisulfide reductase subunit A